MQESIRGFTCGNYRAILNLLLERREENSFVEFERHGRKRRRRRCRYTTRE